MAVAVEIEKIALAMQLTSMIVKARRDFLVVVELVSLSWQATGNRSTLTVALPVDSSGRRELSAGSLQVTPRSRTLLDTRKISLMRFN